MLEADETFVGGKQKNRATRRVAAKKPVLALVEREGHVRSNMSDGERAAIILKGMEGKRLTYRRTDAIAA